MSDDELSWSRQLDEEAQTLLDALQRGSPEAEARLKPNLPQVVEADIDDVRFALAREWGFANWDEMLGSLESEHGLLAWLGDREMQILIRSADERTMVRAVKRMPSALQKRFFGNMSDRMRAFDLDVRALAPRRNQATSRRTRFASDSW